MHFKEICTKRIHIYYERTLFTAIRKGQQYINLVRIYLSPSIERNSHRLNIPTIIITYFSTSTNNYGFSFTKKFKKFKNSKIFKYNFEVYYDLVSFTIKFDLISIFY